VDKAAQRKNVVCEVAILLLFLMLACPPVLAGHIVAWGRNEYGQCDVPKGNDFVDITSCWLHSLAVKSDGSLVAWGRNILGECNVPEGNDFVTIAAGNLHSVAVAADGSLVAWGSNHYGQCDVPAENNFVDITAGEFHNLAVTSDGSLVAWGSNDYDQCNVPESNDFSDIASGGYHCLALKYDGTLAAWGRNDYGQCDVPEGNDFVAIAGGEYHSLAVVSDGSLAAWGRNDYGECNVPEGNDFAAIAAGWFQSLAIASDGSLVAWGFHDDRSGESNMPAGNNFVAIAGGHNYSLALMSNPATLSVSPTTNLESSGLEAGPFSPQSITYTLSNTGEVPMNWVVSKTQSWVSLSQTSGMLAGETCTTVTVSINSDANSLTPGDYFDTVSFTNTTNGSGNTTRSVSLHVSAPAVLSVTPLEGLSSSGVEVGLFSPSSMVYRLTNKGEQSLSWVASRAQNWVEVSPASGILAGGAGTVVVVSIGYDANSLTPGDYSDTVSFTNTTNGSGNTTRPVSLHVSAPAVLSVTPLEGLNSSGVEGGPFTPNSITYTLSNAGDAPMNWAVGKTQSWVDLSQTSGTLDGGASATVAVSLNSKANGLALGDYSDTISFTNTTDGSGSTTRSVNLRVNAPAVLSVTPSEGLSSFGFEGGPFGPDNKIYTLTNTGEQSLAWTASKTQSWVGLSQTDGMLAGGASTTVTVSINSKANSLVPGDYSDTVSFINTTNDSGNTARFVSLRIIAPAVLSVTPSEGLNSSGFEGGPFSPSTKIYTLTNRGKQSLAWMASKTQSWVTMSQTSGTLASGDSTTVTVSISSNANSLMAGDYSDTISFTNTTNGRGNTMRPVNLHVIAPAVLSVIPLESLSSSGFEGGPFNPNSKIYALTNTGEQSLVWTVRKTQSWVDVTQASGILAGGAGTAVTVSINSNANSLMAGDYSDTISFTNTTNERGNTTRSINIAVRQQRAPVRFVDADAPDGGNGRSWETAYNDLQVALAYAASSGGAVTEIWVAAGTYTSNYDLDTGRYATDRTATFQLINGVAIKGGYAGLGESDSNARNIDNNKTILSGDLYGNDTGGLSDPSRYENSYHVVSSKGTDATAVLDGFTVTGGMASDLNNRLGGGMYNYKSSATITNCTFSGNAASYDGGGMSNYNSSPTLTNCTFSGNLAIHGGGMYNTNYSSPTLTNCTFNENLASQWGGGMYNTNYSSPTLTKCTFGGNLANDGSGMFNRDGNPTLTNCTFSRNSADWSGGGMYNSSRSPTLTNCTFSENSATGHGGGMRNYNVSLTLTNCILWTNSDSDGVDESAQIHTDGGKLVINYCCVQGWTGGLGGTDNISKDPLFVDMAAGDYHLRRNSPCIDAGNPNSDFSLEPKPNGGRINIGVYGNTPEATSRVP